MKWPKRKTVEAALRLWAEGLENRSIAAVGYFGSYSRDDAGVGSDLDVIMLLHPNANEIAQRPFEQRGLAFDFCAIPVPVDVIVYTLEEWTRLEIVSPKFYKTLRLELIWVWSGFKRDGLAEIRRSAL